MKISECENLYQSVRGRWVTIKPSYTMKWKTTMKPHTISFEHGHQFVAAWSSTPNTLEYLNCVFCAIFKSVNPVTVAVTVKSKYGLKVKGNGNEIQICLE